MENSKKLTQLAIDEIEELAWQHRFFILDRIAPGADHELEQRRSPSPAFPGHAAHKWNLVFNTDAGCWLDFSVDRRGLGLVDLCAYICGIDLFEAALIISRHALAAYNWANYAEGALK